MKRYVMIFGGILLFLGFQVDAMQKRQDQPELVRIGDEPKVTDVNYVYMLPVSIIKEQKNDQLVPITLLGRKDEKSDWQPFGGKLGSADLKVLLDIFEKMHQGTVGLLGTGVWRENKLAQKKIEYLTVEDAQKKLNALFFVEGIAFVPAEIIETAANWLDEQYQGASENITGTFKHFAWVKLEDLADLKGGVLQVKYVPILNSEKIIVKGNFEPNFRHFLGTKDLKTLVDKLKQYTQDDWKTVMTEPTSFVQAIDSFAKDKKDIIVSTKGAEAAEQIGKQLKPVVSGEQHPGGNKMDEVMVEVSKKMPQEMSAISQKLLAPPAQEGVAQVMVVPEEAPQVAPAISKVKEPAVADVKTAVVAARPTPVVVSKKPVTKKAKPAKKRVVKRKKAKKKVIRKKKKVGKKVVKKRKAKGKAPKRLKMKAVKK